MTASSILEVAQFEITPGSEAAFEAAIAQAFIYLQQTDGYQKSTNCSAVWSTLSNTYCSFSGDP
jgi:hypothetical protein